MATSGTINGTISGTKPYLRINWSRIETDVGGNRSKLRLQLYLMHPYTVRYSATKNGVLQGASFSSSTSVSGTGSTLLRTQEIWVGHNADGSKTQSLSASFNINITYSGSKLNQLTVSGDAHITAIPRASTLSAFSFASHLKPNTEVNLNYTIDRKSDSFRHQIQLRDGSHTVQTWDNVSSDGSSSVKLSTASVNSLLNRMNSVTTRSLTLRIATRSGNNGGWIGSAVSRNATATVHADVKPTVGAVSLSQTGNSVSSHYLQGKSKIEAKFTRSAGYGASISSSSIQVRRVSGGADSQTINSNDGTTKNPVALNGSYQARGTAKDSRGRTTNTAWATFEVTAYSGPRITKFSAVRDSDAETTVNISRAGAHTPLDGKNVLTYTVQRKARTGAWTNVDTNASGTSTTASFSGTSTSTGNSVTSSYDFRMVITDKFGESVTATVVVTTQRVVLDIHKNEGVGIGKIHEQGALDVDGEIFLRGSMEMTGEPSGGSSGKDFQFVMNPEHGNASIELGSLNTKSTPFIDFHSSGEGKDYDARILANSGEYVGHPAGTGDLDILAKIVNFTVGSNVQVNGAEIVGYGNNERGHWIRYYDGSQICWGRNSITTPVNTAHGSSYRSDTLTFSFPIAFHVGPFPMISLGVFDAWSAIMSPAPITNFSVMLFKGTPPSSFSTTVSYIAIGRWK